MKRFLQRTTVILTTRQYVFSQRLQPRRLLMPLPSAAGESRTLTGLPPLVFETSLSAIPTLRLSSAPDPLAHTIIERNDSLGSGTPVVRMQQAL